MSWKIEIHRAKPNPAGKDRAYGYPKAEQLLGEWVTLKNVGDAAVTLSSIHLAHNEMNSQCTVVRPDVIYWTGLPTQTLHAQQTVRVHTGNALQSHLMAYDDQVGVDLHAYAGKGNFVLNNACGDALSVWWKTSDGKWHTDDRARYGSNPREGGVLIRVGALLI